MTSYWDTQRIFNTNWQYFGASFTLSFDGENLV